MEPAKLRALRKYHSAYRLSPQCPRQREQPGREAFRVRKSFWRRPFFGGPRLARKPV